MKNILITMGNNIFYTLSAAIVAFFTPIVGILMCIFTIVLLDTVMGIWASIKEKKPIRSGKLFDIIPKLLVYLIFVIVVYLVDLFLACDIVAMYFSVEMLATKLACLIPIIIEFKSIDENTKRIWGVDVLSIIKKLLKD